LNNHSLEKVPLPKDTCDIFYVDEAKVTSVAAKLKRNDKIDDLSEIFKLIGDPTRLKIILALKEEELCVCDLATLLGITRSAVSHQLRLLRGLRLVKVRREGKMAYYSLKDCHITMLIQTVLEHANE